MRRRVDLRWVRRTFARMEWLADRVDAKQLANVLAHDAAADADVQWLHDYLGDVWENLRTLRPEREQPCAVCGRDIRYATDARRPDVRYCSAACRQRAYRARVTDRQMAEQRTRHDTAVYDASAADQRPDPSRQDFKTLLVTRIADAEWQVQDRGAL